MIGAAVRTALISSPAFSNVAGSSVYPLRVPQGKDFPAVVYFIVSNNPANCKGELSAADEIRMQFSVFAESYGQLETIAAAIRTALDGYEDAAFSSYYMTERDLYEDNAEVYHKSIDYSITVNR